MAQRRSWTPAGAEEQCVVLVGGGQALQDEAARVGAAAGVALLPAPSVSEALRHHPSVLLLAPDSEAERVPPGCPVILVGLRGEEDAVWAAAARRGAGGVAVLPQAAGWLAEYLGRTRSAAAAGRIFGVLGASGGAGTSTLSCWLADCAAAAGSSTLLMDGESLGGGLELALGGEPVAGMHWEDLTGVRGVLNPAQFAAALPAAGGFSVLSHGPGAVTPAVRDAESPALEPVLDAARQGFGVTVVDLGGPAGIESSLAASCDGLVFVVPARLRPVAAAAALLPRLAPVPVRVVLRGPVHSGLDPHRVAGALDLPEPAFLPHLRGVAAAEAQGRLLERGRRRLPRRLCRSILGGFSDGLPAESPDGRTAA
jgi:secretion/DNA translocation related CpaE-like protein